MQAFGLGDFLETLQFGTTSRSGARDDRLLVAQRAAKPPRGCLTGGPFHIRAWAAAQKENFPATSPRATSSRPFGLSRRWTGESPKGLREKNWRPPDKPARYRRHSRNWRGQ